MATALAKQGKPHYIEIQGAQYEGSTVWFNTLVAQRRRQHPQRRRHRSPRSGHARDQGVSTIMRKLATLARRRPVAARPDGGPQPPGDGVGHRRLRAQLPVRLPVDEGEQARACSRDSSWAPYPAVDAGQPAQADRSAASTSPSAPTRANTAQAFDAALCLRNRENQMTARGQGRPAADARRPLRRPELIDGGYPFAAEILASAGQRRGVRPQTPAYQNVSIAISPHPFPAVLGINPEQLGAASAASSRTPSSPRG